MTGHRPGNLRRTRGGTARVTNVELFFDLVYVFAVTQLSHYLIDHQTVGGALQALLLLTMVWLVWAYTTWVTNWLDPERIPVRLMLLALTLVSLVMSAALPGAFGGRGLAVGVAYAVMQIGRSVFAVAGLRGDPLQRNYQRILAWCVVSGGLAVAGGLAAGHARELLWLATVAVDILGGLAGFWTPGLGRSSTRDWTIEGSHFAERCQAFILIALGESLVVTGATLSRLRTVTGQEAAAFLAAFVGSVGLWWLYFHRSAEAGAQAIASSADPGRLGRSAYHLIHPVMVAGIIVVAAGDQLVLRPARRGGVRAGVGHAARRHGAVPDRPRRVQGGGVAHGVPGPDRRGGCAGPARRGGPARHGAGAEHLHGGRRAGRGHRRLPDRTGPAKASARRVRRYTPL